jgi:hypothetical protein
VKEYRAKADAAPRLAPRSLLVVNWLYDAAEIPKNSCMEGDLEELVDITCAWKVTLRNS